MVHGASIAVFIAQLVVLLVAARVVGELMQRIGQPALIGQIIAGVLLGPSVLGALAPAAFHQLFPATPEQHAMLQAVAQLGILLLLLLTGMEMDVAVFRDARRPAICISLGGIVVPFACGCAIGALLPDSMVPAPGRRLLTALFLGTALAISSVKIVALVIRDLGFLRRRVGQMIIASAILDDTLGWIIMSVIFGLALHGSIDLPSVTRTVVGTVLFLALAFTIGRRLVFRLIRWSNDVLSGEMATVTTILVVAGVLALLTSAIGVHYVLGTFIAGILIGQSPILTRQLDAQLRGLIIGLFMPVFFVVAGMTANLGALAEPRFLWLTGALIALASLGKFLGAFLGGRAGGLTGAESFAAGCGMNARGSTEVIVASIGLQIGALNLPLFTAIVAMAVLTTMAMPPMLRWAFARLPVSDDERARLDREDFEARAFLPQVERLLVAVDATSSGRFASHLAGLVAGARGIQTTVLHLGAQAPQGVPAGANPKPDPTAVVKAAAAAGEQAATAAPGGIDVMTRTGTGTAAQGPIAAEARKGYGLLMIGHEPAASGRDFSAPIAASAAEFQGPFAIAIARGEHRRDPDRGPLGILVTVSGTRMSRHGAEVAVALAHASHGSVTALHVDSGAAAIHPWRRRFGRALIPSNSARAAVREIIELGEHYGVAVHGRIRQGAAGGMGPVLLRELATHDLLVMGVSARPGEQLFLGDLAADMLERAPCSLLFVCAEASEGSAGSARSAG